MRSSTRSAAFLAVVLAAALAIGPGAALAHSSPAPATNARQAALLSRPAFHDAMRKLWEDHITWTRLFIVSFATDSAPLADLGPTTDRLLANQVDIGNAIAPFYGRAAGAALTALLKTHIQLAGQLLAAAKANDATGVSTASAAWYANATAIAAFLHRANPRSWPLKDLEAMMKSHLDLTLAEAVARLQGRFVDDIAAYDQVHAEILSMADMLSAGIIRQFPSRFDH